MPLINGCKYSCEPCIRGHRATSCVHTDRILIEVRKPGRPLESCGHEFSTCQCGKVAALFSVKGFLDSPMLNSAALSDLTMDQEPTFFVEAQPAEPAQVPKQPAVPKTRKSKVNSQVKGSRVSKKSRTKSQSSSNSSALIRDSRESSATASPPLSSLTNQEPSSNFAGRPDSAGPSASQIPQYSSDAARYAASWRETYHPPDHLPASQFPRFSSRVEDVGGSSGVGNSQAEGQTVSSQYIMATEDTVWRAG